MREQIKQDIDLIEILFYLKKKIRVILFIMAICMAMVLLFLYINKDNIKVIYSLKINQTTPSILVSCDSNNNFACQTTMTEDVIQRITTFFHTSPDVKNREIRLEWSGDKRALPTAEEEISRVQASIIKWYASEYHNGRQVLDEIQTPSAINSELYTKMIYLTRNWSLYPNGDGCVTISSPEIKNKYPAAICLALGFFLSIVISVMFCLVKKMVDEYQQNSGQ
ncbi:protein YkgH [Escherichia coli]|nr:MULTISPECIES: protein YkgH [Escherichia]EEW7618408.1 hypothetical protein [Escherichia coli]EFB5259698.1 hypothetical protein [Escherichia coli]EFB5496906.1 hypothetical protein [Escherichia coli]EFB5536184.1 hypothetical protein [Escherichia coli]EFJ2447871.1 hypothetical protein [Escherichia coli]